MEVRLLVRSKDLVESVRVKSSASLIITLIFACAAVKIYIR